MYAENKPITLYRGDDQLQTFPHSLAKDDITEVKFYVRDQPDGTLYMQVKYTTDASQFTLSDEYISISLVPDDTSPLGNKTYRYDIEVTHTDGDVTTIQYGDCKVIGDISTEIAGDSVPSLQFYLSSEQHDAVEGANSPSADNPFATMDDLSTQDQFSEMEDVALASLLDNQILRYDSASTKWKNESSGITDGAVLVVDGDPNDDEFARFTANGIEGRTTGEAKTDLGFMTDWVDDTSPTAGGDVDMNDKELNNVKVVDFTDVHDNALSGAGTKAIDWREGQTQKVVINGNCTYSFTAPDGPCVLKLIQTQDSTTGSRNPVWPATVKWESGAEPTWSTGTGQIDICAWLYDGTNYYGGAGIGYE